MIADRFERLKYGMADPVICDRLLLWGIMSVCTFIVIFANFNAVLDGASVSAIENSGLMAMTAVSGILQAVFLSLTFVPPKRYKRWVRERAGFPSGD